MNYRLPVTVRPRLRNSGATIALVLALLAGGVSAGGCASGSLAADSWSGSPGEYSTESPQLVHIGETVRFSLMVSPSADDYAIFRFPGRDTLLQAGGEVAYRTQFKFDHLTPRTGVLVTAAAYRIRGQQDYMEVAGQVLKAKSPYDVPDDVVARASIKIIVYQLKVDLSGVGKGDDRPDWSKSFVRMVADGGKRVSKDIPMAGPGTQLGYLATGPDNDGRWSITYLPTADQLNRGGKTLAEFHLTDVTGKTQIMSKEFPTP